MSEKPSAAQARYADRRQNARGALGRLRWVLRPPRWFPQVPLFLGLAAAGLILLLSASGEGRRILVSDDILGTAVLSLSGGSLAVPQVLLGVAMLTMSVGLLRRSRVSWVVSLLLTAATLGLALRFHHSVYAVVAYYDAALFAALLLAYRAFDRSSILAGGLFAVTSALMLLLYAVFGSYYLGAEFNPPIKDLVTALYYSVVTMSTVGYGDIAPRTAHARLFAISIIVLGITVFATSISVIIGPIIGGSLRSILNRQGKRMKRKDHYIIIGQTSLAGNTYRELRKRNLPVTLILAEPPSGSDFADADIVIGDPTDLGVLRQAGAADALAVLAMRADDSENAFVVLAVKELEGKAKTVVAVNDSKHVTRLKRVHPDIMIAPQVLGGELLAMALSGEPISGDFVRDRFLHFDA